MVILNTTAHRALYVFLRDAHLPWFVLVASMLGNTKRFSCVDLWYNCLCPANCKAFTAVLAPLSINDPTVKAFVVFVFSLLTSFEGLISQRHVEMFGLHYCLSE